MMLKRVVVGVVLVAIAVTATATSAGSRLPFLNTQLVFVVGSSAVGSVVVLAGMTYLVNRDASAASPPAPEGPAALPEPGEEVEEQLATLSEDPFDPDAKRTWKETHEEVSTHLRSLAVNTLSDRYNLTPEEAERLLESGTWSEDSRAVAFFRTGTEASSRTGLRAESATAQVGSQARHAIDELGAIARGELFLPDGAVPKSSEPEGRDGAAGDDQPDRNGGEPT